MNFVDYRIALGLGFNDISKNEQFLNKINIILSMIEDDNCVLIGKHLKEYCFLTGINYDDYYSTFLCEFDSIRKILNEHSQSINEFLAYFMPLVNIMSDTDDLKNIGKDTIGLLEIILKDLHINYQLVTDNDGCFILPKGADELDFALVTQPLYWLIDYPETRKAFLKSLKDYSNKDDSHISEIADGFRKALERFFQEFFNIRDRGLEKFKPEYSSFLKGHGVPGEIISNLEALFQLYTNFNNNFAKHQDKTSENVLEYIMYQTGNIIRLLITLKNGEH